MKTPSASLPGKRLKNARRQAALAASFCAATLSSSASGQPSTEPPPTLAAVEVVKTRLVENYVASADSGSPLSTEELLAGLAADGSWPDLLEKYAPEDGGTIRYVHFLRTWKLAGAWQAAGADPRQRVRLEEAIHRALAAWLGRPHPPSKPWFYQIGSPQALGRAALIFATQLRPAERDAVVTILRTAVRPDGITLDYSGEPATGQNLMHEAEAQIAAACLLGDARSLDVYVRQVEAEIQQRGAEGIQPDWSFHQHGPQLYSGAFYGSGFARDGAHLAAVLRETPFAFSPDAVASLGHYVLDGQRHMSRGRRFDYATAGRAIARPDFQGTDPESEKGPAEACDDLAVVEPAKRGEFEAFARQLRGQDSPGTAPAGNHLFWRSDYMSHQRPGFFASARMSSRRVRGTECGPGQNELGYHLGDGAMALMVSGEEYHNVFPLWDWRRIPGVSCVDNPAVPFPRHTWGKGSEGWSDFAGGVSDGTDGAAAMELHRGGLHARKAWFFLGDVIACLGADLIPDDPGLPVVTSVNQCWAHGAVTSSAQPSLPLATGGTTFSQTGPGWVHHDGIAYLFPEGGEIRVWHERKSAPWSVIYSAMNTSVFQSTSLADLRAEGEVFSLWIEHGKGVYHPTTYAYVIAPGLAPSDIPAFQKNAAPRILANTAELQAVTAGDLVQVVFWQAGALTLPDGRALRADQPCALQLRRADQDRKGTLAASDPTQRVPHLLVQLDAREFVFDLPTGPSAGQAVVKELD